ncbi:hypothetical protein [Pseudomonas kulmbachensis]|uniref:hypothetical protein n=1 Tax=Pseudomonas kulmbachensis TaxID=3043408 RepID=UPI002AB20FD9|nr:hypothetical protein [Pseudomonas sp. V3/3/4/13]
MFNNAKVEAFTAWHDLLVNPELELDAQERYDELLKFADGFQANGIIDSHERRTLIEIATVAYTRAVTVEA